MHHGIAYIKIQEICQPVLVPPPLFGPENRPHERAEALFAGCFSAPASYRPLVCRVHSICPGFTETPLVTSVPQTVEWIEVLDPIGACMLVNIHPRITLSSLGACSSEALLRTTHLSGI